MASPATTAPAAPPAQTDQIAAALNKLADLQQTILNNAPLRTLTFAEMIAREPKREMPFPLYQNGFRIDVDMLTDEQLALLPKLQVGRFYGRRIHVYRDSSPDRGWNLDYANKSLADRVELAKYGRDLTEILQRLTTETPDLT